MHASQRHYTNPCRAPDILLQAMMIAVSIRVATAPVLCAGALLLQIFLTVELLSCRPGEQFANEVLQYFTAHNTIRRHG